MRFKDPDWIPRSTVYIMDHEDVELDMTTRESCLGILISTVAWTTIYYLLCLFRPNKSKEWHCRTITMIHALLICAMCLWSAFVQGPWPYTRPGGPSNSLQQWICIICVGYFLFDFAWCIYFEIEGLTMTLHHLVSIFGNFIVIFRAWNGTEMIATILGTEISNPLLQTRWFLRQSGRKDSWSAEIVDILFMLTFGIMRIGLGSHLYYVYFNHPRADVVGKTGGLLIYLISWAFWIMMIQYAVRKYKKMYNVWKSKQSVATRHSGKEDVRKLSEQNGTTSRRQDRLEKDKYA